MSVTVVTATDRDRRRTKGVSWTPTAGDAILLATSLLAIAVIWWSASGRLSAIAASESAAGRTAPLNLAAITDAAALDAPLAGVFATPGDRALAVRELWRFIEAERSGDRRLANVGTLARVEIAADRIERARGARVFAARLREARDQAAAAGREAPASLPLLTPSDLAALKPQVVVRTADEFRRQLLRFAAAFAAGFFMIAFVWRARNVRGDLLLLTIAHALTGIGFALIVSLPDPLRDSLLFVRYAEAILIGQALLAAASLIPFSSAAALELTFLPLLAALALSALLILFGSGPGTSGAKVNIGPVQPIEAIRLLLALFLAGYFARHWELIRGVREPAIRDRRLPAWLDLPRAEYVLPVAVGVGASLVFFFFQKDLGPALFICCVFLAVYGVARARIGLVLAGLAALVLGFYAGYRLDVSHTLTERVAIWRSPWDNSVPGGVQVAHALWAMSTGGIDGTGFGLGDTRYLPAGHTDLILAALGEEWGLAGLLLVSALYAALVWRVFAVAQRAANDYGFFLAISLALFLIVPVFIMASGIMGLTPLTGVVTPFLSYGGSAMTANFIALGILASIRSDARPTGDAAPFRIPMHCLVGTLAAAAAVLLAVAVRVQAIGADDLVVRPHLGVQGDGGRRFAYNPRLIDLVRDAPHGSIFDRTGLPLATDDAAVLQAARERLQTIGLQTNDLCPPEAGRCYPLGGAAFHLLGDLRSRVNWSAQNTSYVERDDESALRGFDDHAAAFRTVDVNGRSMITMRRDYRELVPVLRHRHDPDHPAVRAFQQRSRDLQLTIDAALQLRSAAIVARYAKAAAGRAAAVVIDPATGALLASASYPWPEAGADSGAGGAGKGHADPFLDRARYGLYPPGSTFKLVTAAAALQRHGGMDRTPFTCSRLPDGRVGAKIKGWGRPIRDDIKDSHPHGTIDMHEGLVHSCNAYFAQLALSLGPGALSDAADRLGIALVPAGSPEQRVRDTLPQIGYGQGDVVVTPLRMARVAGAIASGGLLRDVSWTPHAADRTPDRFLDADAARTLAGDMREAVVRGTGRSLRDHAVRIAGKTGTAEVNGKASHSWFVGFTPADAQGRQIAFAVIVENAGYGSASAVPAAGEIVSAAAAAGLIEAK